MSTAPEGDNDIWCPHPEHLRQAGDAASRLIQGSIIQIPGFLWYAVDGQPLTEASANQPDCIGDGSLMAVASVPGIGSALDEESLAMMLSQSCEIARSGKPSNARPFATICPVLRLPLDARKKRTRGSFPHLIDVGWHTAEPSANHVWVADLSLTTTAERSVLIGRPELSRPVNDSRRRLSEAIARYFGRPGLPGWVSPFMEPVSTIVAKHAPADSSLGRVLDLHLHDLRLSSEPQFDDPGPYVVHVTLVPDGDIQLEEEIEIAHGTTNIRDLANASDHLVSVIDRPTSTDETDLEDAWRHWGTCLLSTTQTRPEVAKLILRVCSKLSPDQYWTSESIDLKYLSAPDPRASL